MEKFARALDLIAYGLKVLGFVGLFVGEFSETEEVVYASIGTIVAAMALLTVGHLLGWIARRQTPA